MTTLIEWTHLKNGDTQYAGDSLNPITGCRKKSPACANCYAIAQSKGMDRKLGHKTNRYQVFSEEKYDWSGRIVFSGEMLLKILPKSKSPKSYFVCSISDVGLGDKDDLLADLSVSLVELDLCDKGKCDELSKHEKAYHETYSSDTPNNKKRFDLMRDFIFASIVMSYSFSGNKQNKFLFVTKRPDVLREYLEKLNTESGYTRLAIAANALLRNHYDGLSKRYKDIYDSSQKAPKLFESSFKNVEEVLNRSVWLGVTVESQPFMDRLDVLASIPYGQKHFVSAEPLLTPLDFSDRKFDWLILGGESGSPDAIRETELGAFTKTIVNARSMKNPPAVFVKQMGSLLGKRYQNRDKKGGNYEDFPPEIKIQEFPDFD
jgi:protein gp37